jgi:hypothetical protein
MAQRAFDEIQHDPISDPPDVSGMSDEDAVEAIKVWFLTNFEDPVHETPRDDGSYVYIWGGPYDTDDIIENVFAGLTSDKVMADVIRELEYESFEWVPNSSRRQDPEDEHEDPEITPDATQLFEEMQRRVQTLEDALANRPRPPAGIGHNKPPAPLDPEPLNAADIAEIDAALAILKQQPPEPANDVAAKEALGKLETKREKLSEWLLRLGVVFTEEAVKEAGKEFGKWAPRAFWIWVLSSLIGVTNAVSAWLAAIPPF